MNFYIAATKSGDPSDIQYFSYDNEKNILARKDGFVFEYSEINKTEIEPAKIFDKNNPLKKSNKVTFLKIQLGLSCNYSCEYCSQKFVERAEETTPKDIDNFLKMMDSLEFDEESGLKIEFWGGEPLVYWKTLRPLAEAIKERFYNWSKPPRFSIITNGSILTKEMCMWLYYMGFSVSISHDGPGQSVRGPDPFDDPKQKKIILDFYKTMSKNYRFSFNAMLNSKNKSRKEIYEWFVNLTGDADVALGEGGIVDAYDEDGLKNSLSTKQEHFEYRRQNFNDIFETQGKIGFHQQLGKIDGFTQSILTHLHADTLGQKCGMDDENTVAIDLRGNVITCQNVSSVEVGMNGEDHLSGHISDMENVSIKTATHWRNRKECSSCPVVQLCKGSCMFLEGKYWEASCDNAYSDNIVMFALSFEKITGYIPFLIKSENLPKERQDIWGKVYKHEEKKKQKIIPIKVVTEKKLKIDDIEVYAKSVVLE